MVNNVLTGDREKVTGFPRSIKSARSRLNKERNPENERS